MEKMTISMLAALILIAGLYFSSAFAGEIDVRNDTVPSSYNNMNFDRDLGYGNSDYRFN